MILKRILQVLALLFGVLMLLWCIVVGVVATPEVITPKIEQIAQQYVKSDLTIKSVDLSLFERFPNITLRIDSLRIPQTKDSISDLLFAEQCYIAVNPFALLAKNVVVERVTLHNASIYLYVDSLHGPVKTFDLSRFEQQEPADSLDSFDFSDYTFALKGLKIDSTQIVIDERVKEFYTRVENWGVDMSMNLTSSLSELDVATGFSNLIVWHKGDLLVKKTSMDLESEMLLNMDSLQLSFDQAKLRLNGIEMQANGVLRKDSLSRGVWVDVATSLSTPSIAEFLALIPPTIIDNKEKITTQGAVQFDMTVTGLYFDDLWPTLEATLRVEDGVAKYDSRQLSLEQVDCDAYMYLDPNQLESSYADVYSLHINTSEIIDLTVSGKVKNLINNPTVDMTVKSDIDFDRFSEVFPLKDGVKCSGTNRSNIKMQFSLADIQNSNYANLYVDGVSTFHNLDFIYDASKFVQDTTITAYLSLQAERGELLFGDKVLSATNSRTLRSKINVQGIGYRAKSGEYLHIKDIDLTVGANFDRKTSVMNGVGIGGVAKNMEAGIDSLFTTSLESSDVSFIVIPKKEEQEARVKATISSQQVTVNEPIYQSDVELSTVDMNLSMQRVAPRQWDMDGTVAFSDLGLFTQLFPLPIKVSETSVSVKNRVINLNNAHMTLGNSELVATGHIENLMRKLFVEPKETLKGTLKIEAPYCDMNELMLATNHSVLMEEAEMDTLDTNLQPLDSLTTDTVANMLFLVPRKVDFVFDLNMKKTLFEESIIEDMVGRATLKSGVLSLDSLRLMAIGAEAKGALVYRNVDRERANVAVDMYLSGVDITRIGELVPSVESMFPMLESFEGRVDFDLKANTNLIGNNEIDLSTLYSAMRFKGENLVLMDSETFGKLSKMLMFKNKKRNLIDSVEAYALVEGTKVDLLPFSMTMDRYRAIIGGSQVINPETFDVDYTYNVSIMKSPLPFKAGVDITGNLDDFKFKITSAKLKRTNFEVQRGIYEGYCKAIDQLAVVAQQQIDDRREKMRERRAAQRKEQEQQEQKTAIQEERDSLAVDSLVVDSLLVVDTLAVVSEVVTDSVTE